MYYYEVLARSHSYLGNDYLTYESAEVLPAGAIVRIELRHTLVLGIVMAKVSKPTFQTKSINAAISLPPLPLASLELIKWLQSYYPAPLGLIAQLFLPTDLPQKITLPVHEDDQLPQPQLPPLTVDQRAAMTQINDRPGSTVLLHGDTGTGKTRVYIELARQQLKHNKSVLLLTPEISLTPQLVQEVKKGLPGRPVIVMHSTLSAAERRKAWLRALLATQPVVIIGPRSALFAPLASLGLVIIDEFHEPAYKQEQAPYYQSLRVASQLARLHQAQLLLGSATPTIADYYLAEAKQAPIIRMNQLAVGQAQPTDIELVDLRDRSQTTRHPHLSNSLLEKIESALARQEQALVFLNRRGTARLVLCQSCGWQALCPRCDLPLTYHNDSFEMRCHTCGYHQPALTQCKACQSNELLYKSIGTKSLAEALAKLFPKARIQRFDSDSSKQERFEQHYDRIKSGQVDIIVGTQLLAKGLDLPRLSVVGVVLADSSLYLPDYTAEERTYQLLNQVLGRIGRGHRAGTAVIQTYRPDGPAILATMRKDWPTFYAEQLKEREAFLFPPFCFLMKLSAKRASKQKAQQAMSDLARKLADTKLPVQIIGPSPAFHEKIGGKYEWQLVIKARDRRFLLQLLPLLPANCIHDLDPSNLL